MYPDDRMVQIESSLPMTVVITPVSQVVGGCRGCYHCGSLNHFARNCPQHCSNPEAPDRSKASKSASSLGIEATVVPESLTTQQLEQLLAKRRLEEERSTLTNRVQVDAITTEVGTPGAVGPIYTWKSQLKGNLSQQLLTQDHKQLSYPVHSCIRSASTCIAKAAHCQSWKCLLYDCMERGARGVARS